eukprot:TRINITY_DN5423_c0_g1_i3.p1 TRINITY_DN5423_c0_g1~~TRINITY_DN5423_c0_g1_i3.p1  ORF type:complete len:536 (-),score=155.32 TRINITY_DN5423_c0_g1_i3:7-1614(-)
MTQYIRTIGRLEPSYVIRKFLDAQRIHNLTLYLQTLHEKNLANGDHTTLLLNCYTKLRDTVKLNRFVETDTDAHFDVDIAIKVLRSAGYFSSALYLAKKHKEHAAYVGIQIDDAKNYEDALDYISRLPFFDSEKMMKQYGKTLVSFLPEQTTRLLMLLCTNYSPKTDSDNPPFAVSSQITVKARPEEFIHIFVDQPQWLLKFLENATTVGDDTQRTAVVYNTLLELYLSSSVYESNVEEGQKKAMSVLQNERSKYDADHALALCQAVAFRAGILFLYERLKLYQDILQYYMDNNDYEMVITSCKRFGDKDSNLWVQVLGYFAERAEECHAEIKSILSFIDKDNILPPLLVVQILAQHEKASLAVVKDYISRRLQQEQLAIAEDQRQIRQFKEETEKMRAEMQELRTTAKIFQLAKCTACTSPLELPSIHFLCMHSFHQRCLVDNEGECPLCAPSAKKVFDVKRQLEQNAGDHDTFFKQLEGSADGFTTVSEFFGRGMFNRVVLVDGEKTVQLSSAAAPPASAASVRSSTRGTLYK